MSGCGSACLASRSATLPPTRDSAVSRRTCYVKRSSPTTFWCAAAGSREPPHGFAHLQTGRRFQLALCQGITTNRGSRSLTPVPQNGICRLRGTRTGKLASSRDRSVPCRMRARATTNEEGRRLTPKAGAYAWMALSQHPKPVWMREGCARLLARTPDSSSPSCEVWRSRLNHDSCMVQPTRDGLDSASSPWCGGQLEVVLHKCGLWQEAGHSLVASIHACRV